MGNQPILGLALSEDKAGKGLALSGVQPWRKERKSRLYRVVTQLAENYGSGPTCYHPPRATQVDTWSAAQGAVTRSCKGKTGGGPAHPRHLQIEKLESITPSSAAACGHPHHHRSASELALLPLGLFLACFPSNDSFGWISGL